MVLSSQDLDFREIFITVFILILRLIQLSGRNSILGIVTNPSMRKVADTNTFGDAVAVPGNVLIKANCWWPF